MSWLPEMLSHEFARRALLGGALAGFLCGIVGAWAVLRRMALTTDALSHAMFPGLAIAAACVGLSPLGLLLGGLLAALFVAGGAEIISRTSRVKADAATGILYTGAYAVGLAVLAATGTRAHIEHWLFGDIFGLGNSDLWQLWTVAVVVVPLLVALERPLALAVIGEDVARRKCSPPFPSSWPRLSRSKPVESSPLSRYSSRLARPCACSPTASP